MSVTGSASSSPTRTGAEPHELLVDDVPVIAIPRVHESGLGTGTPGRLVVAAIPSAQASEVAAAAATSILIPVWTR